MTLYKLLKDSTLKKVERDEFKNEAGTLHIFYVNKQMPQCVFCNMS